MKKRYLFMAVPFTVMPVGGISMAHFVQRMAPHLTKNEMALECVLGSLAIVCLSMFGTCMYHFWYSLWGKYDPNRR